MHTYVWTYESFISGRICRKLVTDSRCLQCRRRTGVRSIFTVCDSVFCILTVGSYDFFQNTWNTSKAPQVILTCTGPSSLDFHVRAPDNLMAILFSPSDRIKMRIAVPLSCGVWQTSRWSYWLTWVWSFLVSIEGYSQLKNGKNRISMTMLPSTGALDSVLPCLFCLHVRVSPFQLPWINRLCLSLSAGLWALCTLMLTLPHCLTPPIPSTRSLQALHQTHSALWLWMPE